MNKLELKHIVGYLPYGLKIQITQFEQKSIITLKGISVSGDEITVWDNNSGYGKAYDKKTILRPLDLKKEIEVNGVKFVPIEALYQISVNNIYNYIPEYDILICDIDGDTIGFAVKEKDSGNRNGFTFNFSAHRFEFDLTLNNQNNGNNYSSVRQDLLIQKLYEWHFDIHGLIEQGLAIDINTLDKE